MDGRTGMALEYFAPETDMESGLGGTGFSLGDYGGCLRILE